MKQLMDQIATGAWSEGDRVPAEHELAETLGVGRTSIREALKAMQVLGLVTRSNEGTFVADVLPLHVLDERLRVRLPVESLDTVHLYEARRLLEGEIASLAAQRCDPVDLQDLEGLWSEMKALPLDDLDRYLDLDMAFHKRMCRIAANPVLTQMWTIAFEALRSRREQVKRARQSRVHRASATLERPASTHSRLLEAMRRKDREQARAVVHEVLTQLEKSMIASVLEEPVG